MTREEALERNRLMTALLGGVSLSFSSSSSSSSSSSPRVPVTKVATNHLARYITPEAALSLQGESNFEEFTINGKLYHVSVVDYTFNAYEKPVTPASYLNKTRGVGSNICGFLRVDSLAESMANSSSDYSRLVLDVTDSRDNFVITQETATYTDGAVTSSTLRGSTIPCMIKHCCLNDPIPVPTGIIRAELGDLMVNEETGKDCSNPFEVNFISNVAFSRKMLLFRNASGRHGLDLHSISSVLKFIRDNQLINRI